MKKLTLFFPNFNESHLVKDVFIFPFKLAKRLNMTLNIYSNHEESDTNDNGINFINLKNKRLSFFKNLFSIIKLARNTDILFLFHFRWYSVVYSLVYKLLNPNGYCYIKGDLSLAEAERVTTIVNGKYSFFCLKNNILKFIYLMSDKGVDLISAETKSSFEILSNSNLSNRLPKIVYIPNGISSINKEKIEKEKMIINVARIGTPQKNTEFLLSVLDGLDLGDWSFYFIGSIEDDFNKNINKFFVDNPQHKDRVFFIGNLTSYDDLQYYYMRSYIFMLSSIYESYALVLNEAAVTNNYIISSDVGCLSDLINIHKVQGEVADLDINSFRSSLSAAMNRYPFVIDNELDSLNIDNVIGNLVTHINTKGIK